MTFHQNKFHSSVIVTIWKMISQEMSFWNVSIKSWIHLAIKWRFNLSRKFIYYCIIIFNWKYSERLRKSNYFLKKKFSKINSNLTKGMNIRQDRLRYFIANLKQLCNASIASKIDSCRESLQMYFYWMNIFIINKKLPLISSLLYKNKLMRNLRHSFER